MGLRERLCRIRERRNESLEEDVHPDTGLMHDEHVRYIRTIRYDEVLYQRRELPHIDKQVSVVGSIWGFPDLVEPPRPQKLGLPKMPKLPYQQLERWSILLSDGWYRPDDGFTTEVYLRSLCSLGLVKLSWQRNWREILCDGLGMLPRELPRTLELKRFRELFPDHAEVFGKDAEGYYRVFSIVVPSGRITVEYMRAAFVALRSAVRDEEADLDLPEEVRIRLARSVATSDSGLSIRRLARAFDVPIRSLGGA